MNTTLNNQPLLLDKHAIFLKRKGYSVHTVRIYRININYFFRYLRDEEKEEDLKNVDKAVISRYQSHIFTQVPKLAPATQLVRLLAIKSLFGFLEYENHILYDPTVKIELPRKKASGKNQY